MTCELKDILYDVKYVDLDKKPDWFLPRILFSFFLFFHVNLQHCLAYVDNIKLK